MRAGRSQTREPLGRRLLDRPFAVLAAGLVILFAVYTGWGIVEILTLPLAKLP